jgi:hypothetical protein
LLPIRLDHGVRCHRPPLAPNDLQARTMVAIAIETEASGDRQQSTRKQQQYQRKRRSWRQRRRRRRRQRRRRWRRAAAAAPTVAEWLRRQQMRRQRAEREGGGNDKMKGKGSTPTHKCLPTYIEFYLCICKFLFVAQIEVPPGNRSSTWNVYLCNK